MDKYAPEIAASSAYLHLYQLIIVDDILGYSRDIGSRNTLWIPNDFTVKELINYLKDECINDPKLCEIRRIDSYLNPFQPNNWRSIDNLSNLDGTLNYNDLRNTSQSRRIPVPDNEYREVEPIELLKIREKARNTTFKNEHYVDTSDFFNYFDVPSKEKINEARGDDDTVPDYLIKEQSMDKNIESKSYLQQIDEMEEKLNQELLARKEWYLNQMKQYKSHQIEKNNENQNEDEDEGVDTKEELKKIDGFITDEFDNESLNYGHIIIDQDNQVSTQNEKETDHLDLKDGNRDEEELCAIHFTPPPKKN